MFEAYATLILHTLLTPFLPAHEVNGAPMRIKSGYSLIELIIAVAIVGILLAVGSQGCVTTDARQASAERNARAFAAALGWQVDGVICSGIDTPRKDGMGDGYVSCTLALYGDAPTSKAIVCGYDRMIAPLGQNTACKETLPVTVQY